MDKSNSIINFQEASIRKVWHEGEWFFSVVDVIEVLTDSPNPSRYWNNLKSRDSELSPNWVKLKFLAQDGKMRPTDCAPSEGILRIIMSIPSPKAEPFKLWLAEVGKERLDEASEPEIAIDRLRRIYEVKGYPQEWIESRLKAIGIRKELTDEWQRRGIKEDKEYSILTATVAKYTFGMTPSEHKAFKGIEKENLRDHMTNLELVFSMLSEELTRNKSIEQNAIGFQENHEAAIEGGSLTKELIERVEAKGTKVVSNENFKRLLKE
jgi:hypothetical protein